MNNGVIKSAPVILLKIYLDHILYHRAFFVRDMLCTSQAVLVVMESEYFTGDTSIDIHSPGPKNVKTSLWISQVM